MTEQPRITIEEQLILRRRQREAIAVAEPYIHLKCEILSISPLTYIVREGEPWKVEYPPEVQAQLAEVDRMLDAEMARLAEKWKLEYLPRVEPEPKP